MITHKNTDPRYGIRVKTCSVEKHLSQEQLGDAIGTSKPYICKIENAKQSLTSDMAKRLSEVLGVRWEYLMLLDDYRTEEERSSSRRTGEILTDVFRDTLYYMGYDIFPATEKKKEADGDTQRPTKYILCRQGDPEESSPGGKPETSEQVRHRIPETVAVLTPEELDDLMRRVSAAVRHEMEYALQFRTRKATEGERREAELQCCLPGVEEKWKMLYNLV